ncbi:MAG: hypothetical protein ACKN9W_11550 [Methylococcus sp.]
MKVACIDCGAKFYRDRGQTWKKRCMSCWIKLQPDTPSEVEHWKARAHLAEARLALCSEQFTPDELKALRRLVHPDKHQGSEAANRITQKINALLRELR